jgi:hypothetical protein
MGVSKSKGKKNFYTEPERKRTLDKEIIDLLDTIDEESLKFVSELRRKLIRSLKEIYADKKHRKTRKEGERKMNADEKISFIRQYFDRSWQSILRSET